MLTKTNIDANDVPKTINTHIGQTNCVMASLANAAGQTLTPAQVLNGILVRSGAAGVSDTMPTAAALVAAYPGAAVGDVTEVTIINQNTGTLTIVAGTGITLSGTTTIPTVNTRRYALKFTNVTLGSEAVTMQGVCVAAN